MTRQRKGFSENRQSEFAAKPAPMRAFVEIGKAGRIVVPAAMRAAMGVAEGDKLSAVYEDGELRLESQRRVIARVQRSLAHLAVPGVSIVDELIADRRREAAAGESETVADHPADSKPRSA